MVDRVAILFQALSPSVINGQRKAPKPGGYSDSGADIGFALRNGGIDLVTPVLRADPATALDWVFPDTIDGINEAMRQGATVLWANTVLFSGHPLEQVMGRVTVVGQLPADVEKFDDKFRTNHMLTEHGLPTARSFLLGRGDGAEILLDTVDDVTLSECGLAFPLVVKPVRGRGSQGVVCTKSLCDLKVQAESLLASGDYGTLLILEEYLDGEELTVTVMPPASSCPPKMEHASSETSFWGLRPVCRFNHTDGVAPYNGAVAVTRNSRAISRDELLCPSVNAMMEACLKAAQLVDARAPIRVDCRADREGVYRLFDLNMKPNMTGAGRPGREDQDSLSAIAARADGWTYFDLLKAMLEATWIG